MASSGILGSTPPPPQQQQQLQKPYFGTTYTDNFDSPHGWLAGAQKLCVYEINDLDRQSPKLLVNSNNTNAAGKRVKSLGDLLPYTNKLYDGTLKERLGITAGMCIMIEYVPEFDGDRYECQFSAYFGEYGHISVQGPYTSYCDCVMAVTGGTGIFTGARGVVKCKTLLPTKLFYEFHLLDIHKLPAKLTQTPVPPTPDVIPEDHKSTS
jgi:allene oxide cyclase